MTDNEIEDVEIRKVQALTGDVVLYLCLRNSLQENWVLAKEIF
jgi:hypothetical protein